MAAGPQPAPGAAGGRDAQPIVALVPEYDDYLRPAEAIERFAPIPQAKVVPIEGGRHLWLGEKYVRRAHDEIVKVVRPGAGPLSHTWNGPVEQAPQDEFVV